MNTAGTEFFDSFIDLDPAIVDPQLWAGNVTAPHPLQTQLANTINRSSDPALIMGHRLH